MNVPSHRIEGLIARVTLALVVFFGGGAWALRDGIRLRRELAR